MVPVEIAPEIGTLSPILRSAQLQLGQVHGGEWADPGGWIARVSSRSRLAVEAGAGFRGEVRSETLRQVIELQCRTVHRRAPGCSRRRAPPTCARASTA